MLETISWGAVQVLPIRSEGRYANHGLPGEREIAVPTVPESFDFVLRGTRFSLRAKIIHDISVVTISEEERMHCPLMDICNSWRRPADKVLLLRTKQGEPVVICVNQSFGRYVAGRSSRSSSNPADM